MPYPTLPHTNPGQNIAKHGQLHRILLLLLGALLAPLPAPALGQAQSVTVKISETSALPQALVISVRGKCEFSTDGGAAFQTLNAGQILSQGAVVRTGEKARTDIFFRRVGTTVRLQPSTEIRLEKMARFMKAGLPVMETLLDLRAGRIFTVVRSLVPGSTLEIRNAAGRSVVEGGGGKGRYIITADGTQVADKDSAVPLKVIGETGITIITPGQRFDAKEGKAFPLDTPDEVEQLINLDELQSLAEQLTPSLASKTQDDSEAVVLSVEEHATFQQNEEGFKPLRVGQVLTQGAVIRTTDEEGVVDLFLRRWGTTVRLFPDTELGLEKMTRSAGKTGPALETRLHLPKGRIFCFIRIPVPDSAFEVRTLRGRTQLESTGAGRYDIRASGTIVAGKSSFSQLNYITEHGVTVIAPGQKFSAEDGHLLPAAPSEVELLMIQMDQLVALAEHLCEDEEPPTQP